MTHDARLLYVYGLVLPGFDAGRAPGGLDDVPVEVVEGSGIAALVSKLPSDRYGPRAIEASSGDVTWLSPRAMAHDRVLTWAQDHGGVIPLPMFSLWGNTAALSRSLAGQARKLKAVFQRVSGADEFGLRVHRRDSVMLDALGDFDADVARRRREAQAAPPGQRYLLERKLAEEEKGAVRGASQRLAKEIFERLRKSARQAIARPLLPEAARAPDTTLVLNGAFLVDRKQIDDFRGVVGELVREYQPRGLSFDFTGPWPPYNFVSQDGGTALRAAKAKRARKK